MLGFIWLLALGSILISAASIGVSVYQANEQKDLQEAAQRKAEDNQKGLNEKRKLQTDADQITARSQAATGILYSKVMATRADLEAKKTRAETSHVGRPSHFVGRPAMG